MRGLQRLLLAHTRVWTVRNASVQRTRNGAANLTKARMSMSVVRSSKPRDGGAHWNVEVTTARHGGDPDIQNGGLVPQQSLPEPGSSGAHKAEALVLGETHDRELVVDGVQSKMKEEHDHPDGESTLAWGDKIENELEDHEFNIEENDLIRSREPYDKGNTVPASAAAPKNGLDQARNSRKKSSQTSWRSHGMPVSPSSLPTSTHNKQEHEKHTAYISFGSNLGNRVGWIEKALNMMTLKETNIKVKKTSSLWETAPMYVTAQDHFLNGVCEVSCINTTCQLERPCL